MKPSTTELGASGAPGGDPRSAAFVAHGLDYLALDLLRATSAAAAACRAWIGAGDKHAADAAAVTAMRSALATVPGRGVVVVGEGEKDAAPMLYVGEEVGTGQGPAFDLAIDPLEGTNLCATGAPGAVTVLGVAPAGTLAPLAGFYMDKLVVGPAARGAIDIDAPIEENLRAIARARSAPVGRLRAAVLARPRNEELIARIRATGAGVVELRDGDVMAALSALVPDGEVDLAAGIGGAPEGVVTACAVAALGGDLQGRLAPQSDAEHQRIREAGQAGVRYTWRDLAGTSGALFVASGVTTSATLRGVVETPGGVAVQSLLASPTHGLLRIDMVGPSGDPGADEERPGS